MLTTWASATEGSARRATIAVRTVFSCVASGDRGRAAPPGYREAGNNKGYGALREIGLSGFNWASTVRGPNAHYLGFSYIWIDPQTSNYRAYGFQLRCLQEHPEGVLLAIRPRKAQPSCAERHTSGTLTDEKRRAAACGRTTPIA